MAGGMDIDRLGVAVNVGPPPAPVKATALTPSIVVDPDLRHTELDIERWLKTEQNLKLDGDGQLCPAHCAHLDSPSTQPPCPLGPACPLRHSAPSALNFLPRQSAISQHGKTVCKHWLRGLCKKGRACEFLHEYELRAMPECWFFGKYGFCSNGDECMYLHVDERMRVLECMDYRRGFCPKGTPILPSVATRIADQMARHRSRLPGEAHPQAPLPSLHHWLLPLGSRVFPRAS